MKSYFYAVLTTFAVAAALGVASPGVGASEPNPVTKKQVKALINNAHTSADHIKLAEYYRFEAKRLRENAKDHDEMAAEYFKNPGRYPVPKYPNMGQHCRELAAAYSMAADKATNLANGHEAMAKQSER